MRQQRNLFCCAPKLRLKLLQITGISGAVRDRLLELQPIFPFDAA